MEETKAKSKKIWIIIGIIVWVIAAVTVTFYFCYRVRQVTERMVFELGDKVSEDLHDYIDGFEFAVTRSELDLSGVKQDKVGEYEAVLTHGWQEFTYAIIIEDTTAPELTLKEEQIYLKLGAEYDSDKFVEEVQDVSGSVELELKAADGEKTGSGEISFAECGTYKVTVTATDPSGNRSRESLEVVVDTAPVILGMPEYYIAVGSRVDYLEGITAEDTLDGDVTDTVEVDTDDLDTTVAGDYEIIYTATDDYGLVTEEPWTIHVMEKTDLQEAINTHRINRHEQQIVGAYNLYDAGYYETDDVDYIQEVMEPTMVVVLLPNVSRGSGFILEITDEYVLVCTNRHVVKDKETVEICFHEGSKETGTVVAGDKTLDIALVEVKREDISEELMNTLMTVHIDMSYWESLENEEPISLCFRTLNENGSIWRDKDGIMLEKEGVSEYKSNVVMTKANMGVFAGSSGSAIFDGHGNLIAMIMGHEYHNSKWVWDWGVRLTDIMSFYYQTYNRQLYYQ